MVKFYNGTEWVALGAGAAAGTYTTRGIIFDWDPGNVTGLSDGGSTTNANLVSGINKQIHLELLLLQLVEEH